MGGKMQEIILKYLTGIEMRIPLESARVSIGGSKEDSIFLSGFPEKYATILVKDSGTVFALNNGGSEVFLNKRKLSSSSILLKNKDEIKLKDFVLVFRK
jgi:hypothetical protein